MEFINREDYLDKIVSYKDKKIIKVITGIRRCGKSTLLREFEDYLLNSGIKERNIVYINFAEHRFNNLLTADALHAYIEKKCDTRKTCYLLLDEIQNVQDFQKCINSLFLKDNVDIYITGSNSHMLANELATYLSGRYVEIHMLPLSFAEYLSFFGNGNEQHKYNEYSVYGGFPYLLDLDDDSQKMDYLSSLYSTVVLKDVMSRKGLKDAMLLKAICTYLFENIGSYISPKKISDDLASCGRKCAVHIVEEYLNALMESYIVYKVDRYDIAEKRILQGKEKYYLSDIGFRSYLVGSHKKDLGLLENLIFLELKRRGYQINIGKNQDDNIDFIVENGEEIMYIQVAQSVRDELTLDRVLKSLRNINDNYKKYLITLDFDTNNYDGIKQISVLDFLLGRKGL